MSKTSSRSPAAPRTAAAPRKTAAAAPAVAAPAEKASAGRKRIDLRRVPMQERGRQTMDAVLRAAGSEIEHGGLDRLTTKRIAAAAGLSVGAVYEYFPNKESIVRELVVRWMARIFEAIDEVHPRFDKGLDLISYLNVQVDRASAVYEEQPGLSALFDMLSAMPALSEVVVQHDRMVRESISSALHHYTPAANPLDIEAAAYAIPAVSHELVSATIVHGVGDRARMVLMLRACLMAMASRLMLPG